MSNEERTSTITLNIKADSGYSSTETARISASQHRAILRIMYQSTDAQVEGVYLEQSEIKTLNALMSYAADDTIRCWIATRINGASASMGCGGNISVVLLKELDKRIKPLLKLE